MKIFASLADPKLAECLKSGGVVVMPTDTLYGIVARATNKDAVARAFRIRDRDIAKPCIVLAADMAQIKKLARPAPLHIQFAQRYWPGPLSMTIPASAAAADYLQHRQTRTIAFRVPRHPALQKLLKTTGLLIAPSANPAGLLPATTMAEAMAYFGDKADGYVDGGDLSGAAPSTLVAVHNDGVRVLRQGQVHITPGP